MVRRKITVLHPLFCFHIFGALIIYPYAGGLFLLCGLTVFKMLYILDRICHCINSMIQTER